MISAPTGGRPKVIGSSMAMVAIGPTPGSTPISVPIRQPRKHSPRLIGAARRDMPSAKIVEADSIGRASVTEPPGRERDRQPQRELEQADAERRDHDGEQQHLAPARDLVGERRKRSRPAGRTRAGQRRELVADVGELTSLPKSTPRMVNANSRTAPSTKNGPRMPPALEQRPAREERLDDQDQAEQRRAWLP